MLVAVTWTLGIATMGALSLAAEARSELLQSANRHDLLAVDYRLAGCRSDVVYALRQAYADTNARRTREMIWRTLNERVASHLPDGALACRWEMQDAGERLDLALASAQQLHLALTSSGSSTASADSMVAALGDWTDGDRAVRPLGAEAEWYRSVGRPVPTETSIESIDELRDVRGWRASAALRLIDVGVGPVSLLHAPTGVIALLPGVDREFAALIRDARESLGYVPDLQSLAGRASLHSRMELAREWRALARMSVTEPHAWVVNLVADNNGLSRSLRVTVTRPSLLSGEVESVSAW